MAGRILSTRSTSQASCRMPVSASSSTTRCYAVAGEVILPGRMRRVLTNFFRHRRATKTSPNLFAAFHTPCVPTLINLNVKISALGCSSRLSHDRRPIIRLIDARSARVESSQPFLHPSTPNHPHRYPTYRDLRFHLPRHNRPPLFGTDRGSSNMPSRHPICLRIRQPSHQP